MVALVMSGRDGRPSALHDRRRISTAQVVLEAGSLAQRPRDLRLVKVLGWSPQVRETVREYGRNSKGCHYIRS